jgi:beta-galactosidase
MTDALMGREMRMMKEMGVNFLRLGHYQQSRRILELCDELGILVWEEIPWCRGGLGGEGYRGQARRMLANMIGQHYNHACVILWGLGNENDWSGDFPTFDKQAIREFMRELHDLAHQLDGQRKTCIRRCGFCSDIVDVYSPSIWAGWYRGKFTEYKDVSWQEMQKVDHFLHVEWGASHHALRHSEDPDKGLSRIKAGQGADERAGDYLLSGGEARVSRDSDWTETYACNLIDWHLKEQETMDWLTGAAYWPFKDFSTPVRPENPVPYMNQKGVVQRDLTAKETYYVFQSYWAEEAMVHIYGHTWPVRWGEPNEAKMFKVYSNCAEVELLLDGRSLGTRRRDSQDYPAAGLRWVTPLQAGMHRLVAVGCGEQGEVVDEITFRYEDRQWGPPAKLMLQEVAREEGITTVEALLTDAAGVICLDATKVVRFDLAGDGALIDNLGIVQAAREVQLCNGRARIQVRHDGGRLVASVSCERVPTAFISLEGGMSGSGNEP